MKDYKENGSATATAEGKFYVTENGEKSKCEDNAVEVTDIDLYILTNRKIASTL